MSSNGCTTSVCRRHESAMRQSQLGISSFALVTSLSHGRSRRSLRGRSSPALMSRGLLVSSKDRATKMSRHRGPALRRAQLGISTNTPGTSMSHGVARPSGGRSWPTSTSGGLIACSKDHQVNTRRRHRPALCCLGLKISLLDHNMTASLRPTESSVPLLTW